MRKIYLYLLSVVILFSCSKAIRYVGQKSSQTTNVDVFVAEQSIEKPYKIIGNGYLGFAHMGNVERMQDKIVAKGKSIGADAVLINFYSTPTGGTSINSTQNTDSISRGISTTVYTTVQPTYASGYNIVYLKYK